MVLGDSSPGAPSRMLEAAPHRGLASGAQAWDGGVAMVQEIAPNHPFTRAGIHREDRFVATVTGCLFEGSSLVSGGNAAERIGDAYLSAGAQGARELTGAFAAVVTDLREGRTLAVRSPMGERPLFWRRHLRMLTFASEVKQLREGPGVPSSLHDDEAVFASLVGAPLYPAATMFADIHRVPAGTWLEFDEAGEDLGGGTLWEPESLVGTADLSPKDATKEFRRLLGVAVARRMAPDTFVLVSGGLDSTPIAVEAAAQSLDLYAEPLAAMSATYPDQPGMDESAYVRELSEGLDLDIHWAEPHPRIFADLDRRIALHDGPKLAPMEPNFVHLLAAVREAGGRAVLDGHDGDTVFGSQHGLVCALARRRALATWARYVGFSRRRHGFGRLGAFKRYAVAPVLPHALMASYRRLRGRGARKVPDWIREPLRSALEAATAKREAPEKWNAAQVANFDELSRALETLERLAQVEGLALLHPLCDVELVKFLLSLPPEVKFSRGRTKAPVRIAYPEIPAAIREREDKTVFDAVAVAGATAEDMLEAIEDGPQALEGIDWEQLRSRVGAEQLDFEEISLVLRVVRADRFLGSA